MPLNRLAVTAGAVTLLLTAAAAAEPIETRRSIMSSVGAAAKVSGEMAKGNIPFNADVAALAIATFVAASNSYRDFFPDGSEAGDTRARDTIWSDREGFIAANEAFAEDAAAASAAKPADLEAFQATFGAVAENCQACHEKYRVPQD